MGGGIPLPTVTVLVVVGVAKASGRAGVPNLVVPFIFDQFFWGKRIAALGVGPKPIPHPRLHPTPPERSGGGVADVGTVGASG